MELVLNQRRNIQQQRFVGNKDEEETTYLRLALVATVTVYIPHPPPPFPTDRNLDAGARDAEMFSLSGSARLIDTQIHSQSERSRVNRMTRAVPIECKTRTEPSCGKKTPAGF